MNARTSWNGKADRRSGDDGGRAEGDKTDLPLDDILDARFDEEGRLAQIGRGNRQRIAERLDPRPAAMDADELERAVRKLSLGLQAIERQNGTPRLPETRTTRPQGIQAPDGSAERDSRSRDFVTTSLDRLEARLESLSRRLQQRAGAAAADGVPQAPPATGGEGSIGTGAAASADTGSDAAADDSKRREARSELVAEAETGVAEFDRNTWPGDDDPTFAAAPRSDRPTARETAWQEPTAPVARARLEAEHAKEEARRAAERLADGSAFGAALRPGDERDAPEARRTTEQTAADDTASEEVREAAKEDRPEPEPAAAWKTQLAALEARIEALQQNSDQNQIEPIRGELMELLQEVGALHRDGRSIAGALQQVHARLDQVEAKVNAARNMAGNRLSELQDRLSGLTERLGDVEAEVPGFDALRENQSAILERFDRMEGLVNCLTSPEMILERVDALRRQLQASAWQGDVRRVEEQILQLVNRLDALPEVLGDRAVEARIEGQLQSLAAELLEARRHRIAGAAAVDRQFAELSAAVQIIAETVRTPDLSRLEGLASGIAEHLEETDRTSGETLRRLDERLAVLTEAVEKQEGAAAREMLAEMTSRIDALAEAIAAEDIRGSRRDLQALDRNLDELAGTLPTQGGELSHPQLAALSERLDQMQAQLEEISRRAEVSFAQFGPFAQTLQVISERLSGSGSPEGVAALSTRLGGIEERLAALAPKVSDSRALHTQLEGIVSRLELLKGRSIEPARLAELFERVDAAIRSNMHGTEPAGSQPGLTDERLARLERKLDEIGQAPAGGEFLTQEDLSNLRADIVALRRELRSLPGLGADEMNLAGILNAISERLERLPDEPPATATELASQIERIAQLLQDPTHSRLTLAHIETSLKTIEARLEETRRSMLYRPLEDPQGSAGEGDLDAVAGLARALSDDVSVLKNAAAASDQKTKDALEAVQDTLEAVVKRMAFLERDADAVGRAAEEHRPGQQVERASPLVPSFVRAPPAASDEAGAETAQRSAAASPAAKPDQLRDAGAGGLLGRFTSSQLLRRATGGRAESFSPEDEADEAGDLPLEPGTDAPLNSALTGAPSSDTALMSGARSRGAARGTDLQPIRRQNTDLEPVSADHFLVAARRAAQAAATEAAEAERETEGSRLGMSRIVALLKPRRRAILASLLAVAVAFAALQIVRNQTGTAEIAVAEVAEIPAADAATEPAPAPVARASEAPASAVTSETSSEPPPATLTPAPPRVEAAAARPAQPPPQPEAAVARADAPDGAAPARARPEAAADAPSEPSPTVTASLGPASVEPSPATAPVPAPVATAPVPAPEAAEPARAEPAPRPVPEDLPAPIGPEPLRQAARAGDPIAAFEVATRYADGRDTPQDLTAAVDWYRHAAEGGLAPAQYRLGSIYEKGLGVARDPAAAQDWYRRAADGGNVKAMHNLAVLHAEGAGGEPDLERAAELFRQAAEHGVRDSQFNLAILHARGLGVPQDMIEAYKWFAIAASSGDEEALKRRDIIGAALSEDDLAKAQAAANAFEPLPLIPEANDVMMPQAGWGDDTTSVELQSDKETIALVQTLLTERGFDPGPADGLLGEQTTQAIAAFQEKAGLPATGRIDSGLLAALQDRTAGLSREAPQP